MKLSEILEMRGSKRSNRLKALNKALERLERHRKKIEAELKEEKSERKIKKLEIKLKTNKRHRAKAKKLIAELE